MRGKPFGIGLILGLSLFALMAPTGGFPSRPTFQSLRVGAQTTPLSTNLAEFQSAVSSDPIIATFRNSSGVGVGVGRLRFDGIDAGSTRQTYGFIQSEIVANTAGAQSGNLVFYTANAGATGLRTTIDNLGNLTHAGSMQVRGSVTPPSGAGVELAYSGGVGFVRAYDRAGALWRPLEIGGEAVYIQYGGTNVFRTNSADFPSVSKDGSEYDKIHAGCNIVKTADTSRASTTTLSADPQLTCNVNAGERYTIRGALDFDAGAGNGIGYTITGTATMISGRCNYKLRDGNAPTAGTFGRQGYGVRIDWVSSGLRIEFDCGYHVNAGGTVRVDWAQASSGATNTTVYAGSYLTVMRAD